MTSRTFVSAQDLLGLCSRPDVVIVDVRTALSDPAAGPREFLTAHVPRAVHAQLDSDLSGPVVRGVTGRHPLPKPEALADVFGGWGIGPGSFVVAYDDDGGAYAARLWWLLGWLGHHDVAVLEGGWSAWKRAGGALESGPARPRPSRVFQPRIDEARVVDVQTIARDPAALRLLDARAADRFAGENETIDPVGGHIPGARNLPWPSLLSADRMLQPVTALRSQIDSALAGAALDRTVVYCGSGVTACLDLLVMAHVGRAGAKLFPGSWSEWITDGQRGVARGTGG